MTKAETLLRISQLDLRSSFLLYNNSLYSQSLFLLQQSVEKLQKFIGLFSNSISETELLKMSHKPEYLIKKNLPSSNQLNDFQIEDQNKYKAAFEKIPEIQKLTSYDSFNESVLFELESIIDSDKFVIPIDIDISDPKTLEYWKDVFLNKLNYDSKTCSKFISLLEKSNKDEINKPKIINLINLSIEIHYPMFANFYLAFILNPLHTEFRYSDSIDFTKKSNILVRNYLQLYKTQKKCLKRIIKTKTGLEKIIFI